MQTENSTYAEYSTALVNTCFLLPPIISFEGWLQTSNSNIGDALLMYEASTIPFALCTAAIGLYQRLKIPFSTLPESSQIQPSLIIYG